MPTMPIMSSDCSPIQPPAAPVRRFDDLIEQGRRHLQAERLDDALAAYQEAERVAEANDDRRAMDLAFANSCAVQISMERTSGLAPEAMNRLREILMAGDDAVNCRLAAYNVARAYEFAKDYRKGLFYARVALDRSRFLGSSDWLASALNQIGNFLLATSRFDEACARYEEALSELSEETRSVRRAKIYDNLGYAYAVVGRIPEGLSLLYRSLRMLRHLGARREQIFPHLDLAYALLEAGRYDLASRHAERALVLSEEAGEADSTKNALYLLGEATHQTGNAGAAAKHFEQLCQRFFPESPHLPEVLLNVDVRNLVNLKA